MNTIPKANLSDLQGAAPSEAESDRRIADVLSRVEYSGYTFKFAQKNGAPYLQVVCTALCNLTNVPMHWQGRKWMLSEHMTDGEVVQTALKAVLTAVEHEARERFKYRSVAIFDPHYDLDRLVELRAQPNSIEERTAIENDAGAA